jgi:loricrin
MSQIKSSLGTTVGKFLPFLRSRRSELQTSGYRTDQEIIPNLDLELLLMGGGGAGGSTTLGYRGGGGGSGAGVYFSVLRVFSSTESSGGKTMNVSIGNGATGKTQGAPEISASGGGSSLSGVVSASAPGGGGGRGLYPGGSYGSGGAGGSGGGSDSPGGNLPGASGSGGSVPSAPAGSTYQLLGNPAGNITPTNYGNSGGGGATQPGTPGTQGPGNPSPGWGAPGGNGILLPGFVGNLIGLPALNPLSGGFGGGGGSGGYNANGGGNDPGNPYSTGDYNGGIYGGGIGSSPTGAQTPGVDYTGGGGGGCGPGTSGNGGKGVCTFRFLNSPPNAPSAFVRYTVSAGPEPNLATPTTGLNPGNGYTYVTFIGPGSVTFTKLR